jgi:hypothetical protein
MTKTQFLEDLVESPVSRRSFAKRIGLASAGLTGAGVLGTTLLSGLSEQAQAQGTLTDVDILNFALNLEYLEGEFYTMASDGATLHQEGVIPFSAIGGPTIGGHKVPSDGDSMIAFLRSTLKHDEQQHVRFLRSALGSAAVKKPTIDLDALGLGFANDHDFLTLSRAFEDVGVSAYGGALGLIKNKTYLEAAGRIAETESQHSGAIRVQCVQKGIKVPAVDSKDVVPSPQHPFFVDSKALAVVRSPQQVLRIVYAGKTTAGGFFPDGVNGKIHSA